MSAPDRPAIRRLVEAALTAPSADNCQPYRFAWDGVKLAIRLDPARARHAVDHAHRASLFTLGCVLECLTIAATAEGLDAKARLALDRPAGEAWALVRFDARSGAPHPLAGALGLRATDRRFFRGGSPDAPVLDAVRRDAAGAPGCAVHVLGRPPPALADYIARADGYVWRHEDVYRDIIRWIRFSREEVEQTRDGIAWNAFGVDLPEIGALRLSRTRAAAWLVRILGVHLASRVWVDRHIASSGALVCFTVGDASKEALVAAGRLALTAWVRLNQAGWGVQPLGIQALSIHGAAASGFPPGTRPDLVDLFRRGRGIVADAFGYGADRRTLRLPVDRVLDASG
jgi:hypothetical protein